MPYASQSDLVTRFGQIELVQLTDRSPGAIAINTTVLQAALDDADAEIDARLMARYTLPLPVVPRLIKNLAVDIARYRLSDDMATDQVTKRYDAALRVLADISSGKVLLGVDQAAQPAAPSGGPAVAQGSERVFTAKSLGDYAP